MDWVGVLASESVEEGKMSMLAAEFAAQMRKRDVDLEGEPTLTHDGKRPKRSSPNVEAEKDWAIIPVDSSDRASNDKLVLEGALNEGSVP